jgi:hypothetical protein
MVADKTEKTKVRWKRHLDEWKAGLPAERLAEDEKRLKDIFALAAQVPLLAEALDWAQKHDIQFIIDRTGDPGGYYIVGTGVVALAQNRYWNNSAVNTLVHEIRHAWQDYHQMIPTVGSSFQQYYTNISFIEADAMAHGNLAEEQYRASQRQQTLLINQDQHLSASFMAWYTHTSRLKLYGEKAAEEFGSRLSVPGVTAPDHHLEYDPYACKPVPQVTGLDISSAEDLCRLGKGFNGGNYFPAIARDFLQKKVLSSSLALSFYGAANDNQRKLVTEIRKKQIRLKLEKGSDILI